MVWWAVGIWSIFWGLLLLSIHPWFRWHPVIFMIIYGVGLSLLFTSVLLAPPIRWIAVGGFLLLAGPFFAIVLRWQRTLKARARLKRLAYDKTEHPSHNETMGPHQKTSASL